MITDFHFVRAAAARIGEAADAASKSLGEGLVKSDSAFTDRWVRSAAKAIDGFKHQGMRWRARAHVETGSGDDAPAVDRVCAVEVDIPGYK